MLTTIYLMRHSKTKPIEESIGNTLQEKNENIGLSEEGCYIIENISKSKELKKVGVIYSSHYKRTFETAEYIAKENNLDVIVDKRFGERKHGVSSFDELPKDYEFKQFSDENFKVGDGESIKETQNRMNDALKDILNKHNGNRIVIVSHATAIASLLKTWCKIRPYKFNGEEFFDGNFNYCETFKLTFDNDKLIDIENIKYKED